MLRMALFCLLLAGCSGTAWNTTVADHPQVRSAMVASVVPGRTTEKRFQLQWGLPTQKLREGGQVAYIYRNMSNPPGYYTPQFGNSTAYVIVLFQYGIAVEAYSSDTEGCRATFAPRPPGPAFDNPATVHTVGCGVVYDGSTEKRPIADAYNRITNRGSQQATSETGAPTNPLVPEDSYTGASLK